MTDDEREQLWGEVLAVVKVIGWFLFTAFLLANFYEFGVALSFYWLLLLVQNLAG